MTQKILITGAAGFIGRHVAAAYAMRGMHVIGMGRGDWADCEKHGVLEWHRCDVTLDMLIKNAGTPDVIVHCAGGSSVGFSMQQPHQDFIQTVESVAHVLEYMRLHAQKARLVYPSSAAVYGQVRQLPIREDIPLHPLSPYGVHKLMAEQLCASYTTNYDISAIVVRLFSVYGTGMRKQLLWDACQKITSGNHTFFGTGAESRDWLHVSDAAALLMTAGEHADATCQIINGGAGVAAEVQDVLSNLYDALAISGKPHFSGEAREGDPLHYLADISRARAMGWQPKVGLQEGLREYAAWYKDGAP